MNWIKVTDILPDKGGKYLVIFEDGFIEQNIFDNGKWVYNLTYKITHWAEIQSPDESDKESELLEEANLLLSNNLQYITEDMWEQNENWLLKYKQLRGDK